jgi:glycopeptide antibiotics resistance protein
VRWLRGTFLLYLAAVLALTMWPSLGETDVPGWAQSTVEFLARFGLRATVDGLEMVSNAVMFLPFGVLGAVLVAHARPGWRAVLVVSAVAAAGFAFSATIETVQLAIPGRVSTLQDVLLNGAGALVGAACAVVAHRGWLRSRSRSRLRPRGPVR